MGLLLFILFSAIYYVVGSIPGALIIGKIFYKKDIREEGSGNLGATNAGRVLGRNAAIEVTLIDALKGAITFFILSIFNYTAALLALPFVAVGHCYPLFANFKGGKAVATTMGIMLAISLSSISELLFIFIIPVAIWFGIKKYTDLVSLASLFSVLISAVLSTFVSDNIFKTIVLTVLWGFMAYRHKDNILRLLDGTENKTDY